MAKKPAEDFYVEESTPKPKKKRRETIGRPPFGSTPKLSKRGPPTKYSLAVVETILRLAAEGATECDMAKVVGVHPSVFLDWKNQHKDFREALATAKEFRTRHVEDAVFKSAVGYTHESVQVFYDAKRGQVITKRYTKYYPPDVRAAMFFLTNRAKKDWRVREERSFSGPNGEPLTANPVQVVVTLPQNGREAPQVEAPPPPAELPE